MPVQENKTAVLDRVREKAAEVRKTTKTADRRRGERDRAIRLALRAAADRDGGRPRPRFTAGEVAEAAGLSVQAIRKIGAER